jgi:type II secretory pathway pseudopilin PulG
MLGNRSEHQSGFALLIFLVIMMGLGGIALTGVTQQIKKEVDQKRFDHNKEVLNRAKQALLMFAYNYPETNAPNGPGRLPCADIDNDGNADTGFASCISLGRLPWKHPNLNLHEILDADGEHLWYYVSGTFATNVRNYSGSVPASAKHLGGKRFINSSVPGTITIRDQSGTVIYDGAVNGVAAVIIAPGKEIESNGVLQNRIVANEDDPVHYLDQLIGVGDGFILGPVYAQNDIVVNDQIVVITSDEVIEMAEKATLQAYRNAINTYRTNIQISTPTFDAYPWLDDYTTSDLTVYDADLGVRLGRVPSIFSSYFTDQNSEEVFSEIDLTYDITYTINEGFSYLAVFDGNYNQVGAVSGEANIAFNDVNSGHLTGSNGVTNSGGVTGDTYYFWDEFASPDGWEICPPIVGNENDCNQDTVGAFVGDPSTEPNRVQIRVRKVTSQIDLTNSTIFELNYSPSPTISYFPPTADNHAKINAVFPAGKVTIPAGFIYYDFEQDNSYLNSFTPTVFDTIPAGVTAVNFGQFDIALDYFPELPAWALATNDNWHDSIQMAFSSGFEPQPLGVPQPGCTPGTDCLTVNNVGGVQNNKRAVLVLASDHDLVDGPPADGIQNDLDDIFDTEHTQAHGVGGQDVFDARSGNDQILIIR